MTHSLSINLFASSFISVFPSICLFLMICLTITAFRLRNKTQNMMTHIMIIGMYVDGFNLSPPQFFESRNHFFQYSMRFRMPLPIQLKEIIIKAIRHPNFTSTTKQNAYRAIRLSTMQIIVVINFAFLCFTVLFLQNHFTSHFSPLGMIRISPENLSRIVPSCAERTTVSSR